MRVCVCVRTLDSKDGFRRPYIYIYIRMHGGAWPVTSNLVQRSWESIKGRLDAQLELSVNNVF